MGAAGVIGVGLWLILGVVGAWLLVTGRKTVFGLPRDFGAGWPVRVYGLAYVVMAALVGYEGYRSSKGLPVPGGILFIFRAAAFAVFLVVLATLDRRRTVRRSS